MIEKIIIERNLQNRVYEIIKNYLIRPDVPPGTHLFGDKLAKEIGVSRTPVKMALNLLEKEGLVITQPNKGAFKVHLRFQDVVEIVKIRMMLECLAFDIGEVSDTHLVVDHLDGLIPDLNSIRTPEDMARYPDMDQQFHESLIKVGNSPWLLRMIKDQDTIFHMFRLLSLQNIERIKISVGEHRKIVKALRTKKFTLVKNLIREHWESAIKDLEKKHKETPGLFL
jgi:DNA-binding GntR family transcriptional regulator